MVSLELQPEQSSERNKLLMGTCGERGPTVDYSAIRELKLTESEEKNSDALIDAVERFFEGEVANVKQSEGKGMERK